MPAHIQPNHMVEGHELKILSSTLIFFSFLKLNFISFLSTKLNFIFIFFIYFPVRFLLNSDEDLNLEIC